MTQFNEVFGNFVTKSKWASGELVVYVEVRAEPGKSEENNTF